MVYCFVCALQGLPAAEDPHTKYMPDTTYNLQCPPLASAPKFQIRYAHPISLNCHQMCIVIVAKPYAWLQEPSRSTFRSVVIFVKYREVSTRTILPNFIGNCGDSVVFAFWRRHGQKRKRGSVCRGSVRRQVLSYFISTPWPTGTIPLANQNNSLGQPKWSLHVATAVRYKITASLQFRWLAQPLLHGLFVGEILVFLLFRGWLTKHARMRQDAVHHSGISG